MGKVVRLHTSWGSRFWSGREWEKGDGMDWNKPKGTVLRDAHRHWEIMSWHPGGEWAAPGHGHLYVCLPYTCVLAGPCLQVLSSFKILVACSFQSNTMRSICPQGLESHVLPQALGAPAQGGHLPSTSSVVDHISILRDILYLSPHHT